MDFYQRFLRPIFFALDAEQAHDAVMSLLEAGSQYPGLIRLTAGKPMATSPRCPRSIAGIEFPNPIGLAAGMDKNGIALPAWDALGFGFMEIGTIGCNASGGTESRRSLAADSRGSEHRQVESDACGAGP